MTMMKKIALAALAAVAPLAAAAADLVVNGSFEANAQAANTWAVYNTLTGWTGPNIELRNNVAGSAFDGVNFVELDSTGNSTMSQTLIGAAGQYVLSFWYSARPGVGAGSNGISFSLGGANLGSVLVGTGNATGSHQWRQYSALVKFDGDAALSFSAIEASDSVGGSIDKIQFVTSVPEPETYAMMLVGLLAIGGFVSGRRRNG